MSRLSRSSSAKHVVQQMFAEDRQRSMVWASWLVALK